MPTPFLSSAPCLFRAVRSCLPTSSTAPLFAHFATLLPLGMAKEMRICLPPLILCPVTHVLYLPWKQRKLVSFEFLTSSFYPTLNPVWLGFAIIKGPQESPFRSSLWVKFALPVVPLIRSDSSRLGSSLNSTPSRNIRLPALWSSGLLAHAANWIPSGRQAEVAWL